MTINEQIIETNKVILAQLYSKFAKPHDNDELIYHYTSCEGLISIVSKGQFWLSNVEFVNDKMEIDYSIRVITKAISASQMHASAKDEFIRKLKKFKTQLSKNIYILSFSSDYDSLNLWNNYSKNEGYNIGLSLSTLIRSLTDQKIGIICDDKVLTEYTPAIGCVVYNEEEQIDFFKSLFEVYCSVARLKGVNENEKSLINNNKNSIWKLYMMYSYMIKESCHKTENEYRLVISVPEKFSHTMFRSRNGIILPFIAFSGINGRIPYEAITIGPKIDDNIAKEGIKKIIDQYNYKLAIKTSTIKLRF